MTDYKALCAALLDEISHESPTTCLARAAIAESNMDDLRQASADVSGVQILSPVARAVFEAFNSEFDWIEDGVPGPQFRAIAAALRAAVEHCVPDDSDGHWVYIPRMLAIADELENS